MSRFLEMAFLLLLPLLFTLLNLMSSVTCKNGEGKGQIDEYNRRNQGTHGYYSTEDLENVADDDFQDQSVYFVKTRHFGGVTVSTTTTSTPTSPVKISSTPPPTTPPPPPPPEKSDRSDALLNIPGDPGIDYPIYSEVPSTGFDCKKQRYKGFFSDMKANCQAWHYCDFTDGHSTFLCPNGTLFSQVLLICDWWFNVNCQEAQQLYVLNERLYRYVQAPTPVFPEDFHGPEVDLWLKRQLQLGILPKISKGHRQRGIH